eukprot:scaffold764_cov408-Prasinococcus_capsulatus_cf.AAC.11
MTPPYLSSCGGEACDVSPSLLATGYSGGACVPCQSAELHPQHSDTRQRLWTKPCRAQERYKPPTTHPWNRIRYGSFPSCDVCPASEKQKASIGGLHSAASWRG